MLTVKTKLREFSGKGIGLVADQEVSKGQVVWTYHPIIEIDRSSIPEEAQEFFRMYAVDRGGETLFFNTDNARFINHSDIPNTKSLEPNKDNVMG